ncbi:MAG: heavy metal-associated domain-containing protein [Gemmatimonadales bacterium]|jgi:copper chaperone CopZ
MRTVTLNVTGMSCDGCVNSVKSALSQLEGVHGADVSLDDKKAILEVEETVDATDLVGAVETAGYQASVAD